MLLDRQTTVGRSIFYLRAFFLIPDLATSNLLDGRAASRQKHIRGLVVGQTRTTHSDILIIAPCTVHILA